MAETVVDAFGSCTQFLGLGLSLGSVSVSKPLQVGNDEFRINTVGFHMALFT